jgi:hypothetical protein
VKRSTVETPHLSVLMRIRNGFAPLMRWMQSSPSALKAAVVLGVIVLMVAWPWLQESDPFDQIDELEGQLAYVDNPSPDAWPWAPKPVVSSKKTIAFGSRRSPRESVNDAIRVGVRQGLAALVGDDPDWAASLAMLPRALPKCARDNTSCPETMETAAAVGRWATLLYWQCRAPPMPERFWQTQDRLRAALATSLQSNASALALTLQGWAGDLPKSRLCHGVENVLDDVLAPRR